MLFYYIAPRCIHPVTQVILASEVLYDPSEAQEVANAAVQLLQDEARFKSCFLSKANVFEDLKILKVLLHTDFAIHGIFAATGSSQSSRSSTHSQKSPLWSRRCRVLITDPRRLREKGTWGS